MSPIYLVAFIIIPLRLFSSVVLFVTSLMTAHFTVDFLEQGETGMLTESFVMLTESFVMLTESFVILAESFVILAESFVMQITSQNFVWVCHSKIIEMALHTNR